MALNLDTKALALLSAGLRHVRDAEHLLDASHAGTSIDQAYHLAGYGPECVRKATMDLRWLDQVISHQLGETVDWVLELMVSLDPWAARYHPLNWQTAYPELAAWSEQSRYKQTGEITAAMATPVVEQARKIVDQICSALWMDGRIHGGIS